jgi:adenylosuccinate lyase
MKMTKIVALVLACALVAGVVYAQFAKPEEAIAYRKAVMTVIVHHFKQIGAVVQGKAPHDKADLAADADVLGLMATLPWEAILTPGSDKGDTTLNPTVFSKQADLMKMAESFESNTANLKAKAQEGDLKAIKAGFGAVAQDCKACHSAFRKK